ncbi:MAG: amidohydrolase [Xanthomonadales bacterium]|nr:amidohydrolase [Xanthomonadales bacterium]
MSTLRLALVQADTRWHDPAANRELYAHQVRLAAPGADIVLLPETFLSGFSNDAIKLAEGMRGESMQWLRKLAQDTGVVICGSLVLQDEQGRAVNRLVWVGPQDEHHYDKRHLFRMAGEHERYGAGAIRPIIEYKGFRILPSVCYDLRFPVWLRNRVQADGQLEYDLMLFVANWPKPRREHWRTLLRARAIENLAYVAAVNRVGIDGNQIEYAGDSAVIDFLGQPLVELGQQAQRASVEIDLAALRAHRHRFPAQQDADSFGATW